MVSVIQKSDAVDFTKWSPKVLQEMRGVLAGFAISVQSRRDPHALTVLHQALVQHYDEQLPEEDDVHQVRLLDPLHLLLSSEAASPEGAPEGAKGEQRAEGEPLSAVVGVGSGTGVVDTGGGCC